MKFRIIFLVAFLFMAIFSFGQSVRGLERIIVEKYYISDANDAANSDGGKLKAGSTTYRIYVDMLPGYIFQAAYGVPTNELKFATTTAFFNNEDRGATNPKFSKTQAGKNTVLLDSYLSVGAACTDHFGILKDEDNGIDNLVNKDGILKNNNANAGKPLTEQDGLIEGSPEEVTFVSLADVLSILDSENSGKIGDVFSTFNGAWASLAGSSGPDTIKNIVLIGQITTDGVFSFELNVQIRSKDKVVEKYVAKNPGAGDLIESTLTYDSSKTSTDNLTENNSFKFAPNPTTGLIYFNDVDFLVNTKYEVMDLNGKLIKKGFLNSNAQTLSISELNNGVYFLTLENSNKKSISKVVKI
jgi:hypothetical protein